MDERKCIYKTFYQWLKGEEEQANPLTGMECVLVQGDFQQRMNLQRLCI